MDPITQSIASLKAANEQKASQALLDRQHTEDQLATIQTQEIILKSFKSLVEYLDNRISKTQVVNQLREIGTPDALLVVEAVNSLHETLKTHQNTDLTEITGVMREVLEQAKQLPKELPQVPEIKFTDYTKQLSSLESAVKAVEKVVKEQKLVAEAPIVNVPKTHVNVDAPDLTPLQQGHKDIVKAVKGIVIPEHKTDNKEVEKWLKKIHKSLEDFLDTPIGGGGGGSSRATPYEIAGVPTFIELDGSGAIPTTQPVLKKLIDDTTTANVTYIGEAALGTATSASSWRVKKIDESSGVAITWTGTAFDAAWDDRTTEVYS